MIYTVRRATSRPSLRGHWDELAWSRAETARLAHFHSEGSGHQPVVDVKVLHDSSSVFVMFRVSDRYVRCARTKYQDMVCNDSCVEFFVQPKPDAGYFNFEINCGGTMLLYYILPSPEGFDNAQREEVPERLGGTVTIFHSMPEVVEPEITEPTEWVVEYEIPVSLLEQYVGTLGDPAGQTWRGNFYKCGDETSHPHWAMWAPVREGFSFHQPQFFGELHFEGEQDA